MTTTTLDRVTGLPPRRWTSRLRRWRWWLLAAALVAAAAVLGWILLFSSWLGVRTLKVEGTGAATSRLQVTRAAHVDLGTPLARVDVAGIRARVEALPTVASATVARQWPHTVVVRVIDRRAVAAVFRDGSWRLMDETGLLYLRTPGRDKALPIVELDGSPGPDTLGQVAAALRVLPPDILAALRRVRAASMDSITLLTKDGREVRWGSAAQSAQKAAVVKVLLHTRAQTIDVSVPSHPATRE